MKKIIILCFFLLFLGKLCAQNQPNDCVNAITVCGNGAFESNATGIGAIQEVSGCGGFEHNSIWLKINIARAGSLGFNLIPNDPNIAVDYDFWVYGPNKTCSALGSPIRCATTNPTSAGLTSNRTGMNGTKVTSQAGPGADGDGYVRWLTVTVGQTYYIAIDRPEGDGGFRLEWTGTATQNGGAFAEPPVANAIGEVRGCSTNPDVGIFDLQALKPQINPDATNTTITYYNTLADAVDGVSPLGNIISNTTNPQQIFAKVVNNTTGCSSITDFNLKVYPIPTVSVSVSPTSICEGQNATVTFTGTPNATFNYTINGGSSQQSVLNASGTLASTQAFTQTTTYALTNVAIVTAGGVVLCSQTLNSSATVTVNSGATVQFATNSSVCAGNDGVITLTGSPNATVQYSIQGTPGNQSIVLDASGKNIITIPNLQSAANFTIMSVTSATAPFCTTTLNTNGSIAVTTPPVISNPPAMTVCADGVTGFGIFNLPDNNAIISNGNSGYFISYHFSQADAENNANPLPSNYQSTSANQTVYVRVVPSATSSCASFTTLNLITTAAPPITKPDGLVTCDQNFDGFEQFDLTSVIPQVTQGNTNLQVSFYTTENDAKAATNVIATASAFTNTIRNNQEIYIRVVDANNSVCPSITTLSLTVTPKPTVPASVSNYPLCDDNGDGLEIFDLTTKATDILSGQIYTLTYHTLLADANSGTNAIATPQTYQSGNATIYVRSQDALGCFNVTTFQLIVNPLPVITNPDPLFACADGINPNSAPFNLQAAIPQITNNDAALKVYFYTTEADAQTGDVTTALQSPYNSTSANQTVYIRVVSVAGCVQYTTLSLQITEGPSAEGVTTIVNVCDDNYDGHTAFDLSGIQAELLAKNGAGAAVTFHGTRNDAQQGTNTINDITAYVNRNQNTQTVYARVSLSGTTCLLIVEITLNVLPRPVAVQPTTPYAICDNGASDSDGNGIFDLTSYQTQILGANDPAQFTVSYYTTPADAEAATNAIATPASHTSTTGTVYVRVTNNVTGCYDVVTLQLVVNALPTAVQPTTTYTLCDDNNPGDEKESFDLTTRSAAITGGANGVTVTFYTNEADAVNGTNAIATPRRYINTSTVQAIYVKVTGTISGCYRIVLLDIEVKPLPELTLPTTDQLTVCDTNGQGYGNFDLEALTTGMVNNGKDITIAFYENRDNAITGNDPISNIKNYMNIVPNTQVIYVVATNTVTGCQSLPYALTLTVVKAPQVAQHLTDLTICDDTDNNGQDGIAEFDLTQGEAAIRAQLGAAIEITYYHTKADAQAGLQMIPSPEAYAGIDKEEIWVRVENGATDCFSVGSFILHLNQPALLTKPDQIMVCDDILPNDGKAIFDLTIREAVILGAQAGKGITLSYYASKESYDNGDAAIANPKAYTNATTPQVIYIKATTKNGCESFTSLTIRVLNLPNPDTAALPLQVCDTPNHDVTFDLTDAQDDILDNEANATVTYYETKADAEANTNAIADPTAYPAKTGSVWVRVTMNGSEPDSPGCYQVVELKLILNALPAVSDIAPYAICQVPSTGFAEFNLVQYVNNAIGDQAEAAGYSLGFYTDATLATPIANPTAFTNRAINTDTVFIQVTNDATGCRIAVPLELYAEEGATATDAEGSINPVCDYEGDNDGIVTTNLTPAGDKALGTQDPATYLVTYYTSQAAAIIGDTTSADYIQDPTAFENTQTPQQVIWVRVTNSATISKCSDVTSVTIRVEQLPNPAITTADGNYTLCFNYTTGALESGPLLLDSGVPSNGHTYDWYRDGVAITDADPNSGTYSATEAGNYTVIVTSPTGCISEPSAVFEVVRSGQAVAIGQGYVVSNAFSNNQTVTVLVEGYGEYQYSLYPEGPWQESNVFTNVSKGTHTVYVRDTKTPNACGQLELTGVSIIDYPNFFTPNQDGYNDTWNIVGLAGTDATIYIFDRYGKLLKQLSPNSNPQNGEGWNGTFTGRPLPADDYWFTVTFTENGVTREFRSHFAMKR